MTREECVQKAKDIMINKNPYGIYHKYNFDTYNYGEMHQLILKPLTICQMLQLY